MPVSTTLPNYYSHDANGVARFLFRPQRALQVAEMNGVQDMVMDRMGRLASAQFSNGDILSGIVPRLVEDDENGNLAISEGSIYLKGDVRSLVPVLLTISLTKRVGVGIRYHQITVTDDQDATLKDPAMGTLNFGESGAARIVEQLAWGFVNDGTGETDGNGSWEFFPIFVVDHGVIQMPSSAGVDNQTLGLIAQYDRESHGNYVVRGLECAFTSKTDSFLNFDVSAGLANIFGFKVQRGAGSRMQFPHDYDEEIANFEPHVFVADVNNRCKITVNRAPVAAVTQIIGIKQKTVTMTRGLSSNGTDELPDNSVAAVLSVTQGATTYALTTSYLVVGDNIQWSPGGAEPAPGSTYDVVYQYQTEITARSVGLDYIEVENLVSGSMVQLSYTRKLPRIDLIVLNQDNSLARIKGQPRTSNPSRPRAAFNQIALAVIEHDWINDPIVRQIATTNVPYDRILDMGRAITDVYALLAGLQLRLNLTNTDPSSKRGVFADPMIDDDLRDAGEAQTGAIVNDHLELGITAVIRSLPNNNAVPQLLASTKEVILTQGNYTEGLTINPFGTYDPIPAKLKLQPVADRWFSLNQPWNSAVTQMFFHRNGDPLTLWDSIIARTRTQLPAIRTIAVAFEIDGFNPGETLTTLKFDGINVTPA